MGITFEEITRQLFCNDIKEFYLIFKEFKRKTLRETLNQKENLKIKQIWL